MYPYFQKNQPLHAAESTAADPLRMFLTQNPGYGTLVFQVTGEGGAFPVEGASISLRKPLDDRISFSVELVTDESGKTVPISLPAPGRNVSQSPNNSLGAAFSTYDATISAPNLSPARIVGLPIFDGVTTLQPVQLSPVIGRQEAEETIVDEEPNL